VISKISIFFLLFTFFLEFAQFSPIFFQTRIAKLGKFETNKNMLVGGGGGGGFFKTTIYVISIFTKEMKVKYILTSLKEKNMIKFFL
jgi:hypothetical protein